jgi:hypothetical protein
MTEKELKSFGITIGALDKKDNPTTIWLENGVKISVKDNALDIIKVPVIKVKKLKGE